MGAFDRYLAGQRVGAWTEVVSLDGGLRGSIESLRDAKAIARETMRRSRRNIEQLVESLPTIGYVFEPGDGLVVFEPPSPGISADLDEIESRVGEIPLAFRCWLEEVGTVDLMGHHPDWVIDYPDPLVVESPIDYLRGLVEAWEQDLGTEWERQPFTIDFSPDLLHKANVSGGAPYAVVVPNAAADSLVLGERHQTTFVNMVRIAFNQGGFLGWDDPDRSLHTSLPTSLAELASTLEPI